MDLNGLVTSIAARAIHSRRVVVALSGGVDSGLAAWAAHAAVGEKAMATTVVSEFTPARERQRAQDVAEHIGIDFRAVEISVLNDPYIRANNSDRCYHCKNKIFSALGEVFGTDALFIDGTTADDDPSRPGLRALHEHGVFSVLREEGLGKAEIRDMARSTGLPNWDTPSESCLATRIPSGIELQAVGLRVVENLEAHCHALGVETLRVRYDNLVAIVEYKKQYSDIIDENRDNLVALARRIGVRSCRFKEWNE